MDGIFDQDILDILPFSNTESDPNHVEHSEVLTQAAIDRIVHQCAISRVWFCENVLEVELAPWQRDAFEDLDNGETRITIVSGNGVGKTFFCSILSIHYLLFRNDVKIPVTAPASSQLRDGLHPECIKWIKTLPDFLQSQLGYTQDRIVRLDNPENNFVSFRTARKETPEALAGIHATHVMCIVDEASGVDDIVYEAAQGTLSTPGAIFVMIGNGTRLSGYFYNSHNRNKTQWSCYQVTSFDAQNVDQSFVDTIEQTYGLDSNQYRVRVLGLFPTNEEDSLISHADALSALNRDVLPSHSAEECWGVDVGRGGDNSALIKRRGNVVHGGRQWNIKNLMETVGIVYQEWMDARVKPDHIYVDAIGIGAGVADRLAELLSSSDTSVVSINVSELPAMKGVYPRLRDELWYEVKNWIETKICSFQVGDGFAREDVEILIEEICAPLAIYTSSGKNGVESKPQMKARGIKSPNMADALCLSLAYAGSIGSGKGSKHSAWNKPLKFTPVHVH